MTHFLTEKLYYFTKNPSSHIFKRFVLSCTSLFQILGGGCMGRPFPLQILGGRPPSPLSLRPCSYAWFILFLHTYYTPIGLTYIWAVALTPVGPIYRQTQYINGFYSCIALKRHFAIMMGRTVTNPDLILCNICHAYNKIRLQALPTTRNEL